MTHAIIKTLSPSLHWYVSEKYENITQKQWQALQAYQDEFHGQVSIEFVEEKPDWWKKQEAK
jgi:hypothetical protein